MTYVITKTYDMLDNIVFLRYGDNNFQITEYVLEQNPGLERYPLLLPAGIRIDLPDRPVKTKIKNNTPYSLFE